MAASSEESALPIFIVDAFTKEAFKGNPAAVCLLGSQQVLSDDVKQKIAAEMNLSETAFVSVVGEDTFGEGKRFALQWFTPTCEVSLCGHATLASSVVLFSIFGNPCPRLEFATASGLLSARRLSGGGIEMELPAYDSKPVDRKRYERVIQSASESLPVEEVVLSESRKLLVRLKDGVTGQQLGELSPLADDLLSGAEDDLRGLIVTLRGWSDDFRDDGGRRFDFVSRYFSPWLGIPEDPVTEWFLIDSVSGSAHSVLAPYWSKILKKEELYARQCSPRGGELSLRVSGDRVTLSGYGVVVLRGHFVL